MIKISEMSGPVLTSEISDVKHWDNGCENCVFLKHYRGFDLLWCEYENTLIADWGENYVSGMRAVPHCEILQVAAKYWLEYLEKQKGEE